MIEGVKTKGRGGVGAGGRWCCLWVDSGGEAGKVA